MINDTDGDDYGDNIDVYPNDPTRWEDEDAPPDRKNPIFITSEMTIFIIVIFIIMLLIILIFILYIKRKKDKSDKLAESSIESEMEQ
jgi:flagellar biosynthesis/type III secretory pathway M-ring protein FliF/YscJ